jgi:hypothetical protein
MARKPRPELQPFYRLSELVRLTATSRGRVIRMLAYAGVERRQVGGQKLVFVCDIKARMPALWRSIVACEQARNVARVLERVGIQDPLDLQ